MRYNAMSHGCCPICVSADCIPSHVYELQDGDIEDVVWLEDFGVFGLEGWMGLYGVGNYI